MHIWSILFKWWLIDHCKDLVEASPEDRNIILHTWITNPLFSLHFIRICDICRHQAYINRKRRFCINHYLADFLRPRHNVERPFDFSILLHGSKANYWVLDILTYWPCTQHIVQKFAYYLEVPIATLYLLSMTKIIILFRLSLNECKYEIKIVYHSSLIDNTHINFDQSNR